MKQFIFFLLFSLSLSLNINSQSTNIYTIQVATYADPQYKDFTKIHNFGYLYNISLESGLYRVMMGPYSNYNNAKRVLAKVQTKGYKDAFIVKKPIISNEQAYIVQLATVNKKDKVYWGNWQRLSNEICLHPSDNKLRIAAGPFYDYANAKKEMAEIKRLGGRKDIFIKRVNPKLLHKLSKLEIQRSATGKTKAVRPTVKTLQEALNQANYYKKTVDGQWGDNTAKALEQFETNDLTYEKYELLSQKQLFSNEVEEFSLQYYLNLIDKDPFAAEQGLKRFKHPLAKVYLAYIYRNGDVKINDMQAMVNALMHKAIQQVFDNYHQKTRYDFSLSYSYEDIKQLILHLRAVHEAVKDEPDVPCWLFRRHPQVAAEAFAPYFNNERDEYQVSSDCGSFLDLSEMKVLLSITKDMGNSKKDNLAKINQIYAFPKVMGLEDMKALEVWNNRVWKHLYAWSKTSPLEAKTYKTLKITYYNNLRLIEDYFIKKGYSNRDARALGLKVLKYAVGCNLDSYCK